MMCRIWRHGQYMNGLLSRTLRKKVSRQDIACLLRGDGGVVGGERIQEPFVCRGAWCQRWR
ncbi:hypothetical protein BN1263460243 [Stenotrophomonas indicatrix]|nr:hypothetical protein BN1263460243 [Stenotrophomonas indicatrix]